MYKLWEALKEAKKYRWVELSHSLNNDSPYWSGIPEGAVELGTTCFDWGNEMLDCLIQTFKFPGQFGTHIDFPGHFVKDRELSQHYGVKDLIFPLCVVDVSEKVKENPTYAVTADDIREYEEKYGQIPEGAFVALRTDWSKRWPDMDALSGADAEGERISRDGRWRRCVTFTKSGMLRPMGMRHWIRMLLRKQRRQGILPVSAMS